MTLPYTPGMIARLLREMPDADLAAVDPNRFHMSPAVNIVPMRIIRELIDNERATRASA